MNLKRFLCCVLAGVMGLGISYAYAGLVIPMYLVDEKGQEKSIGTVNADDTIYGLLLTPHLHDLPPGPHGFHIHEMSLCGNHGMAAGGHLDPGHTEQHHGPYKGSGHLGDLPVLLVDKEGNATVPVLAPRLKLEQIKDHTLMIHAGADNYSDKPEKLGGGGTRIACGIIPYH